MKTTLISYTDYKYNDFTKVIAIDNTNTEYVLNFPPDITEADIRKTWNKEQWRII
jgi:hypothetical protein